MNIHCVAKILIAALFLSTSSAIAKEAPGKKFDLAKWRLTLPMDTDQNGELDQVPETHMPKFKYPPFFFSNDKGHMVFATPTKVVGKGNKTLKPRSELRQMLRKGNTSIKTNDPKNNFALKANKRARKHGSVGSRMEASLFVNHVPKNTGNPKQNRAYTILIGQINTVKQKGKKGYGYGNEPVKIYYKKWPHHETGSVFWVYERNVPSDSSENRDVMYPVWGKTWDNNEFPDYEGIALTEEFQYSVNIYENTMELTFSADDRDDLTFTLDLSNNVDAYGKVDALDNPEGYKNDSLFFRVGAYNQCTSKEKLQNWTDGCTGTGNWGTDFKNGDFAAVTFTKLKLSKPKKK